MNKIIIILVILFLLSACVSHPNGSIQIESEKSTSEQNKDQLLPEYIFAEIDSYFRMFYTNNQNYKWKRITATTERSVNGSNITGFFDGDSLVKMVVDTYGEYDSSSSTTYYFINEKLTYVEEKIFWLHFSNFPDKEEYKKYFIIDGKLWAYNNELESFFESQDTNIIDYFEKDKTDLLGNESISILKNTFSLPTENNLFNQFIKAKNIYFEKFYKEGIIYDKKNIYDTDSYNFKGLPHYLPKNNAATVFTNGTELRKIFVDHPSETSYTGYEYYLIDNTRIYVIVYYQEFDNSEIDYNDMKKNCYGEYFIVNGKLMVYDPQSMDLIESLDNSDILTYLNIIKESIEINQYVE